MALQYMTSRERIVAAVNHQEPDLLPIDFGGMRSTGISAIAYNRLKAHLGIKGGQTRLYDIFQQLAEPEEEVLRRLGGDVVQLHRYEPSFGINIERWKPGALPDGSPCLEPEELNPQVAPNGDRLIVDSEGRTVAIMPRGSLYYNQVLHPFANCLTPADIDAVGFPRMSMKEIEFLRANAKRLHDETDYAILGAFGGNILEGGQFAFGYERFMYLLAAEPDLVAYFCERLTEAYLDDLRTYLDAVGEYIQVIQMGDDLGTQAGPQLSVPMYREMIRPYHERQFRYIRENSNVAVFLHCCGAVSEYIPDLIEAGVQILNPVQITAAGMEPRRLKREYGKDLCFWGGGARMQTTVLNGSCQDIRREVRELIDIFSPGGGYVFNQVHNILANISPERVLAIYDTALDYRKEQLARIVGHKPDTFAPQ